MAEDFDQWADDGFDEGLRQQLSRSVSSPEMPEAVLAELAPAMKRARNVQRAKEAAVRAVAVVALVGGGGWLALQVQDQQGEAVVAADGSGEQMTETIAPATDDGSTSTPTAVTLEVESTQTSVDTTIPADTAETGSPTSEPATSEAPTTGPSSTSVEPPGPTVTQDPNATAPPQLPSTTLIDNACGSVGLSYTESEVFLLDVSAGPGYTEDVRSSGPDEVKVRFESEHEGEGEDEGGEHNEDGEHSAGDECELRAEMRGGELQVTNES